MSPSVALLEWQFPFRNLQSSKLHPQKVGSTRPAFVRAEITIEVGRLGDNIRKEWESLRPDDIVFLLAVQTGHPRTLALSSARDRSAAEGPRLMYVRTAEIMQILDENGRPLREPQSGSTNGYTRRPPYKEIPRQSGCGRFQERH
jgi:hypothetical protein